MQTPEAAIDLDKCSVGFDQVRETKTNSSQMLQPCELYHDCIAKKFSSLLYKTIVLLAREAFQPKNQVCSRA